MSFAQAMEPPHAQSAMQTQSQKFQVRATQIFKKVTSIRTRFGGKMKQDTEDGPYKRQARSMDVRRNPFMSQPVLALQMSDVANPIDNNSSRSASTSNSHVHPYSQIQKLDSFGHAPMVKSESVPAKQRTNITNATVTAQHLVTNDQVLTSTSVGVGVPEIIVSESRTPIDEIPQGDRFVVRSLKETSTLTTAQATHSVLEHITQPIPQTDTSTATLARPPGMSPRTRDTSQLSSAASTSTRRPAVPRLKDMPPYTFHINEDGSARLSPSIITRPPPMPILNLPTLPTPPISTQNPSSQPRARLRSIPALSVDGTSELDRDPDHEDSGLGESDDEDDAEEPSSPGGSEDEEEEEDTPPTLSRANETSSRTATSNQRVSLPTIDTTPFDLSFISSNTPFAGPPKPAAPHWRDTDATPTASHPFDYFSVKSQPAASVTPRATAVILGSSSRTHTPGSRMAPVPTPGMKRPVMYHHVSKSMVNMSPKPKPEPVEPLPIRDHDKSKGVEKGKAPVRPEAFSPSPEYSSLENQGAGLRRQRSMPIFNITSEPPPYPTFAPHPMSSDVVIQPRDDEGEECLPEYSNSIHLTAIMPRKMEFTAPGVQAKDRKWRRAICELEGTAFRVYKCPHRVGGGGVIGEWWEKAVGVGDVASSSSTSPGNTTKAEQTKKTALERPEKLAEDPGSSTKTSSIAASDSRLLRTPPPETYTVVPLPKPKRLAVNLLHPMTRGGSSPARERAHSRSQSDVPISPGGGGGGEHRSHSSLSVTRHNTRSSSHLNSSSVSFNQTTGIPTSRSSPPASSSRSSFFPISSGRNSRNSCKRPSDVPTADPSDLIRVYSLQHAESGLGNDYLKRKNVIRVRMEGEQFLLQAQDVAGVVEWIEAFHAATNIALDLDERTMPKGPMFPRRRRRRRRAPGGDTQSTEPSN